MEYTVFWFRRDLRLEDNIALFQALSSNHNVLPIFIFDDDILGELADNDPRLGFIFKNLEIINQLLLQNSSSLLILRGNVQEVWTGLLDKYTIKNIYFNKDYEPYALKRDSDLTSLAQKKGVTVHSFKDQLIHEEYEVMKDDGKPYTVFTPYKNKWLKVFQSQPPLPNISYDNFNKSNFDFPTLGQLGLKSSSIQVQAFNLDNISRYEEKRDYPAIDSTSYLGPHLRFGTVSIRQVIHQLGGDDIVFLSELIWREFFMQILFHFPQVVTNNFRRKYDGIGWLNSESDFNAWCNGKTGYPMVDAGMRQLNKTGYMHNRVRMVTAGFLCKHLLIDWRMGEAYFAQKLLDYELASNNGNWQWAAGTGCDAAPYFRIFNPETQLKKFDKDLEYVKKWIPEYGTSNYTKPIVEHSFARKRALDIYKSGILV